MVVLMIKVHHQIKNLNQTRQHLHPHRATPHLWVGMILQVKGDLRGAAAAYNRSKQLSLPYDWQASFRLWRALLLLDDAPAAALEEAAPCRRAWRPSARLRSPVRRFDGSAAPEAHGISVRRPLTRSRHHRQAWRSPTRST